MMVAKANERLYQDQQPTNTFFPLAIEVFGCLHQHANYFFHQFVSMTWSAKGTDGPLLTVLCSFYR
jgi:hypothetical protein